METPISPPVTCPIIVGREPELAALSNAIAQAAAGQGCLALLVGEAGVGKSRLVAEIRQQALGQAYTIMQGRCFEPDATLPYAGLIDMLRAWLGPLSPAAASVALGPMAPHLISLLPEYATLLPQPNMIALDPQQERQRILQAFVQLIGQQAMHNPLLVVIEDLHWSDGTTLDTLLALARRLHEWPILVLATCRENQTNTELMLLLETLERERLATLLPIAPLDFEQTDAMLRAIFHQNRPIRGDFLSVLYNLTEGNPFYVEEVLKALVAGGDIYRTNERWERKALADLSIPRSLRAAVQRQLAELDPQTRELVRVAAVTGRRFDIALIRQITGMSEVALVSTLRALIDSQLFVEETADRYAFRHALTQAVLYTDLLARERRILHMQIATALEQLVPQHNELSISDFAHHCYEGGMWAQAANYAQQAAEQAQRLYAPYAAIEQYNRALSAYQQLGVQPPTALFRARGSMYETLGQADAALGNYRTALEQASAAGESIEQWHALLAIGFFYAARDYAKMGQYLQQALELARTLNNPVILGQSLNRYGNWHLFDEQAQAALRYHFEALEIFQRINDRAGLATTYDLLGVTHLMGSDKPAAMVHYQHAIALFQELGDLPGLSSALATSGLRGISYYHTTTAPVEDGYQAWIRDGEQACELAQQSGWPAGEANALVYLALTHGAAGEYTLALQRTQMAWELAQTIGHPVWLAGAALAYGAIAFDLLDLPLARSYLEEALETTVELGQFLTRRVVGYLARVYIAQRELARAREILLPLIHQSDTPMHTQGQRLNWCARVELALADGDPQLALEITQQLIATALHANQREPGCIPDLWFLQGQAAAALGDYETSADALIAAYTGAVHLGLLPIQWRIQHRLGRLYHEHGRRTLARQAYAQAQTIIQQLTQRIPDPTLQQTFQHATTAILPRSFSEPANQLGTSGTISLTKREREIAKLIAQGHTSREIAATLVLGERTIETHISNILGKLNMSSRRDIAAWAIQVGLAHRID